MLPVNPSPDGVPIGARLRAVRKERKLTIDNLAEITGLSKGFLSRVERDQTSPSVTSLVAICEALSLTVGELFTSPRTELVQLSSAPSVSFGGQGIKEWMVTPRSERRFQVLRSEIEPYAESDEGLYTVDCEAEVVHVIEGRFVISFPGKDFDMLAGDTMTFPGREPHSWSNPDEKPAVVLFFLIFRAADRW